MTYLFLLLLNLKLSNTKWGFIWNTKHYMFENQSDDTNKLSDHFEIPNLATNNSFFQSSQ